MATTSLKITARSAPVARVIVPWINEINDVVVEPLIGVDGPQCHTSDYSGGNASAQYGHEKRDAQSLATNKQIFLKHLSIKNQNA